MKSICDKTQALISIAVAYAINCKPCLEYHHQHAVQAGVTEEKMRAAIAVAKQVRAGAAKNTESVAQALFGEVDEDPCCPPGSTCCA